MTNQPVDTRCRWCDHVIERTCDDLWLANGELCTPERRGQACMFGHYRSMFGIDPLALTYHDGLCACTRTIMHVPAVLRCPVAMVDGEIPSPGYLAPA